MLDQIVAAGTAVGANVFEADEAMSRPDFVKCMSIAAKELSETRFWLRLIKRNNWINPASLISITAEAEELRRIIGKIISNSKTKTRRLSANSN